MLSTHSANEFDEAYLQAKNLQREPTVSESELSKSRLEQARMCWKLLTKAILQEIRRDRRVREYCQSFAATPLSESLPFDFLLTIGVVSERIYSLYLRYQKLTWPLLAKNAVPDEALGVDVNKSSSPVNLEVLADSYRTASSSSEKERLLAYFHAYNSDPEERKGLTKAEKELLWLRFEFARDIKLLALAAAWQNQPLLSPIGSRLVSITDSKSGILALAEQEDISQVNALLNPLTWQNRTQIKDRVYKVTIAEQAYILKERKTSRHRHTLRGGHKTTRSSFEELQVARVFAQHGNKTGGLLKTSWERPIGAVEYPDGYQFVLYEFQDNLIEGARQVDAISQFLLKNWECLEHEYQSTVDTLSKALQERSTPKKHEEYSYSNDRASFSPNDFIVAKTYYLLDMTRELCDATVAELGYENKDRQRPSYHLSRIGNTLQVEAFFYDFEYYQKNTSHKYTSMLKYTQEQRKQGLTKEQFLLYLFFFHQEPLESYKEA